MSNAKQKRDVAKHIAWRNREMPSNVVMVTRPHEKTFVRTNGKGKRPMVSWRKYDTVKCATSVEVSCSVGERPDYLWTGPRLGRA